MLHHFRCGADGGYPNGAVLSDGKGTLYGTAASCGTGGGGVVFSYDTVKGAFRVVRAFSNNQTDGYLSIGQLAMDQQGNIYGVTEYGGGDNLGTVFEITP